MEAPNRSAPRVTEKSALSGGAGIYWTLTPTAQELGTVQVSGGCCVSSGYKQGLAMELLYMVINDNDALPLEYKLQEGRPFRHLDVSDIINNPAPFCLVSTNEGGLEEQLLNVVGGHFGVTDDHIGN